MRTCYLPMILLILVTGCKEAKSVKKPGSTTETGSTTGINKDLLENPLRVHVSADGENVAVFGGTDGEFRVSINDNDYGPFLNGDVSTLSPFRLSDNLWIFRARHADGIDIFVNGERYGPFDEIWRPVVSGSHWGVLVKRGDNYHVLVDGELSDGWEEVVGDHRLEDYDLDQDTKIDVPLFYGDNHWAAFVRRGDDLFIAGDVAGNGPFTEINHVQFSSTGDPDAAYLDQSLCLDRSALAVGVSKRNGDDVEHFLWVNGTEHGPYPELPAFRAQRDMSADGQQWGFHSNEAVHRETGNIARHFPQSRVLSENGQTFAYTYGPDGARNLVVNDDEQGPFLQIDAIAVSPDGSRWMTGIRETDDTWFLLSESGRMGPFTELSTPTLIGNHLYVIATGSDGQSRLILDGNVGDTSYQNFSVRGAEGFRSENKKWFATALRDDGLIDVFETGRVIATTGPFDNFELPRVNGDHWSMLVKQDENWRILEDGILSDPVDLTGRRVSNFHSGNATKMALVTRSDGNSFVVLANERFGPFTQRALFVAFSDNGQHWSFRVPGEDGTRVYSDHGISDSLETVVDWTVHERGAVFVGKQGGEWWLNTGAERHGPFEIAGVTTDGDEVVAAVVENGELMVKRF